MADRIREYEYIRDASTLFTELKNLVQGNVNTCYVTFKYI